MTLEHKELKAGVIPGRIPSAWEVMAEAEKRKLGRLQADAFTNGALSARNSLGGDILKNKRFASVFEEGKAWCLAEIERRKSP